MIARFNLLARCALAFLLLLSLFSGMNAHAQVTRAGIITQPDALRPPPPPDEDPPYNYAGFASQSVPTTMTSGAVYTVTVRMRNSGTTTWTSAGAYALGSRNPYDNGTWGGGRVGLAGSVPPGQTATFTFNVTAPASPGSYNFQWAMVQDGVEWFGPPSDNVVVNVVAARQNNAQFSSQSVPTSMTAGQAYTVTVVMLNTGNTTWNAHGDIGLASANPLANNTWSAVRIDLPATTAPGQAATSTFQIVAPSTPGTYDFQWNMVQDGIEWFGTSSNNVAVVVSAPALRNDAVFVSQNVPTTMVPGHVYPVSISMYNSGSTTWSAASAYRMGSSWTWGVSRAELAATTPPGQIGVFNFQATAPAAEGTYNFSWKMLQEMVEWFGPDTPNTAVTVALQGDTVTYIHTDALGSPVARSDSAGNVISRTSYEPYGRTASGVEPTIGFTGHVNDTDTGLVYMQQRYYDPVAGRFLSVDPVTTDANTGSSFNRYAYANNNPYKYNDPDGRNPWLLRGSYEASYFIATRLGAGMLGSMIGIAVYDAIHSDSHPEPKKDGEGATDGERANSVGGDTEGKRVPSGLRDEILNGAQNPDGTWTCWRCGGTLTDPSKIDIGHKNTPKSEGGNLHPDNLGCEGQSCNRSAGNRGQVKPGSDCISKGCAKPPPPKEPVPEPPKEPK